MVRIISTAALGLDFDSSEVADGVAYDHEPSYLSYQRTLAELSLPEIEAPMAVRCDDGRNIMEGSFQW